MAAVCCLLIVGCCLLFVAYGWLFLLDCCSLFVGCCLKMFKLLFCVYYMLFVARCLLRVVCWCLCPLVVGVCRLFVVA